MDSTFHQLIFVANVFCNGLTDFIFASLSAMQILFNNNFIFE